MKTIYVQTSRVISHDNEGMPIFENKTQKLSENDAFKSFLEFHNNQNYRSSEVVGIYDSETKEVTTDGIEEFQAKLEKVKVEKNLNKSDSDKMKELEEANKKLLERLEKLEALNSESKKDQDLEDLKEKARSMGIETRGKQTIESLTAKIEEAEAE